MPAPALRVPVTLPLALTRSEPAVRIVGVVVMSSRVPPPNEPVAVNVVRPTCQVDA